MQYQARYWVYQFWRRGLDQYWEDKGDNHLQMARLFKVGILKDAVDSKLILLLMQGTIIKKDYTICFHCHQI
jgi:hypothetical protein